MFRLSHRMPHNGRNHVSSRAIAYCVTAWDGPGAGLAELYAACATYAAQHQLTIDTWLPEVVRDDPSMRVTPLLRSALHRLQPEQVLLIAESNTLAASGSVVPAVQALHPSSAGQIIAVTGLLGTLPPLARRPARR